eukprot:PhM_4_TR13991/c0_g1_i1/m.55907
MFSRTVANLIRNHARRKRGRWKSVSKSRNDPKHYWQAVGQNHETYECEGHELEAFTNFVTYKFNKENSPTLLYTDKLGELPPRNRLDAVMDLVADEWRNKDGGRNMRKLQLSMSVIQCVEDICTTDKVPLQQLSPYLIEVFDDAVNATCVMAQRLHTMHPDAGASPLFAAAVCDRVGAKDLRDRCFSAAQLVINEMGSSSDDDAAEFAFTDQRRREEGGYSLGDGASETKARNLQFSSSGKPGPALGV